MNLNFYRLNKTKNYIFLELKQKIQDENMFLNELASVLSKDTDIFQIKNCILSTKDFIELAKKIKQLCAELNVIFFITNHCDQAIAIDCDGIFLEKDELSSHFAKHLLSEAKIIGTKDCQDEDADFCVLENKNTSLNPNKILFKKTNTKLFQGNDLVYLSRAY